MADAGEYAKGGIGGAMSGAAAGTAVLPGWGTAVGAVLGGLAGLFGASGKKKGGTTAANAPSLFQSQDRNTDPQRQQAQASALDALAAVGQEERQQQTPPIPAGTTGMNVTDWYRNGGGGGY